MGIEYQIRVNSASPDALAGLVASMPHARRLSADSFNLGPEAEGWPEASVYLEESGVWFVDHCGGGGWARLEELVAALSAAFGPVTVEEQ